MESALHLLLSLAKLPADEDAIAAVSEDELEAIVAQIFSQLDVDGDGSVSWWEWKTVLASRLSGRNPASKFIEPSDTLVIGMLAAHAALSTLTAPRVEAWNQQNCNAPLQEMLPFIRLQVRHPHDDAMATRGGEVNAPAHLLDDTNPAIDLDLDDDASLDMRSRSYDRDAPPESKAVTRLKSKVNALRITNNVLARRFERAIADAEKIGATLGDEDGAAGGEKVNPMDSAVVRPQIIYSELNRDDLNSLERRVQDSEQKASENQDSFLTAKRRADELARELAELQAATNMLRDKQTDASVRSRQQSQKIKVQMDVHAETVKAAKAQRARRNAAFFALVHFMKAYAVPRMLKCRRRRQEDNLSQKLSNQIVRQRYERSKRERNVAATTIQRVGRGHLLRRVLQSRNEKAMLIQRVARGKSGRTIANEKRAERDRRIASELARQQRERELHALWWIVIALKKHRLMMISRRDQAARKLQSLHRMYHERLDARAVVAGKRRERADRERSETDRMGDEDARSAQHRDYLHINAAAFRIQNAARNKLVVADFTLLLIYSLFHLTDYHINLIFISGKMWEKARSCASFWPIGSSCLSSPSPTCCRRGRATGWASQTRSAKKRRSQRHPPRPSPTPHLRVLTSGSSTRRRWMTLTSTTDCWTCAACT